MELLKSLYIQYYPYVQPTLTIYSTQILLLGWLLLQALLYLSGLEFPRYQFSPQKNVQNSTIFKALKNEWTEKEKGKMNPLVPAETEPGTCTSKHISGPHPNPIPKENLRNSF